MPINGLVVMTPTSIASTGTGNSSSINADGSVDFTDCVTLSLNGVFTSSYDNYHVVMRFFGGVSSSYVVYYRLRASSSDATGNNYTYQTLTANGTTVSGARTSSTDYGYFTIIGYDARSGATLNVFGPNLAQPTATRSVGIGSASGGAVAWDVATTHSLSTSYDGMTLIADGAHMSGLLTVFGFNQ